jgi:diaminopimelate epimerase
MMAGIPFVKMSGAGNDFIIVDNREEVLAGLDLSEFARRVCTPRLSLGADQVMLIERPTCGGDFSMRTINVDGSEVEMCGNGSRCVARYAAARGLAGPRMTIDTRGGPVRAMIEGDDVRVALQLTSPIALGHHLLADGAPRTVHTVRVSGAPHAVLYLDGVAGASGEAIRRLGSAIRHHADFSQGVNVNFVQVIDRHTIHQRTFERGVEGETLACGTGAVASAVVGALRGEVDSPVRLAVPGGELSVAFARRGDAFGEIFLGGPARFVAEGVLHEEAWSWPAPDLAGCQRPAVRSTGPDCP